MVISFGKIAEFLFYQKAVSYQLSAIGPFISTNHLMKLCQKMQWQAVAQRDAKLVL
jgi:hypothetical protein